MIILAFLQNAWHKDPERIEKLYARYPDQRNDIVARFLFAGCKTGKVLWDTLGQDLCQEIIWEEAHPKIGGHPHSNFGYDAEHIRAAIEKHQPDLILTFGTVPSRGIVEMGVYKTHKVLFNNHPAWEHSTKGYLRMLKRSLERFKEYGEFNSNIDEIGPTGKKWSRWALRENTSCK